jgi:hypothetical protein
LSLTASERETVITLNDEDELAHVYTAQRPWITKLKKNPSATLIEDGKFEGTVWARFEVPKTLVQVRSKSKKGQGKGQVPPGFRRPKTQAVALVTEQDEAA